MTLYFEEEGGLELSLPCEELANKVAEAALDYVECPYEATVNLLLTMSDEIREMNKNFRNIDAATDVLSFPMVDYETSGDFSFLEEAEEYFIECVNEEELSDEVISQAEEYGHSLEREFAFLIAHSMLHLFGYDHMEEKERLEMEQMQKEILDKLCIRR